VISAKSFYIFMFLYLYLFHMLDIEFLACGHSSVKMAKYPGMVEGACSPSGVSISITASALSFFISGCWEDLNNSG